MDTAVLEARDLRERILDDGWRLRPAADGAAPGVELRRIAPREVGQRAELLARVERGDTPTLLHLDHLATQAVEAPLLVLELLPGARCVLLETHQRDGSAVTRNLRLHLRLAEGAELQHLRLVTPGAADRWTHDVQVQVGRDARYAQCLLGTAGDQHLQRSVVDLEDQGARAQLAGVLLANGGGLEQQVLLRHTAPGTHSDTETLALPSGAARVVASAHTHIAAGCNEARARQRLCGIPVAGQPRIVLRPHLEIHHDQVQAAHGATWGRLPEDALFHARQRGLDEAAAKALILAGLARSVLARAVDGASLPDSLQLDAALQAALARQLASGLPNAEVQAWAA